MLIWTRWGILAAIVPFVILAGIEVLTEKLFQDPSYYQVQVWPILVGCSISGIFIWCVGKWLNHDQKRILTDDLTQEKVVLQSTHTLFFIRMEWWGLIIIFIGIVVSGLRWMKI